MVGSNDAEPWKEDDVLVSALSVKWVAKNIFLVAVPSYRRKVSCELTAVDVPRGTAAVLTSGVAAVLQRVNSAMRLYLRQDFYSNFPLEGYGDVIFSAEARAAPTTSLHWCSLQEELVRAGVACVVRPTLVRQVPLLAADAAASLGSESPKESEACPHAPSWLSELRKRESSSLFCMPRTCVVEDVMRGDVYRVSWKPLSPLADDARADASPQLPPLLILDSTVCHSPSTEPGFAALRWAQTHLLHKELIVHVHARYPCDKDVAHNTQLETFEHLANVRASASVLGTSGELQDIGVALVTQRLGWVRRVADAGVPRASNLFSVLESIAAAAVADVEHRLDGEGVASSAELQKSAHVCVLLGRLWGLPGAAVGDLLAFHGEWWSRACATRELRRAAGPRSAPALDSAGATREAWHTFMWCADVHKDPNDELRVYRHRPLRTLFPLAGLAEWRVRLAGQVDGAAVVTTHDQRRFLQVEVMTTCATSVWKELRRTAGYSDLSSVHFSPPPGDGMLGSEVRVVVSATGHSDDVEIRLRVCCSHYLAESFLLAQHSPSGEWVEKEGNEFVSLLSLKGTSDKPTVFVLDVVVEGRDEHAMMWSPRGSERAVYVLSPAVDSDAKDALDSADGADRAEPQPSQTDAGAVTRNDRGTASAPQQHYFCKLSIFFELRSVAAEHGDALLPQLQDAFANLMYEEVEVRPVGVAEVNGVRGLVGDLLFPSEPMPRCATTTTSLRHTRGPLRFHRSLLTDIGRAWLATAPLPSASAASEPSDGGPWPMTGDICSAVQASFRISLAKVEEEEQATRCSLLCEVEWAYQLLEQEALNSIPSYTQQQAAIGFSCDAPMPAQIAPERCLCFRAGEERLWHDSAEPRQRLCLPGTILPPTVPLSLFAVRPRELFSVSASQKMKTVNVSKAAPPPKTLLEKGYDQQDWAFMRLQFPSLTNLLHCDWERLPVSLRNTERALCDAVVRTKAVVPSAGMLYTTDRIFSLFLSYLALLQCMQHASVGATAGDEMRSEPSALASVYQALQQYTPSLWDDCKATMHFSATIFVLPPFREEGASRPVPHSRPLFLGTRDNAVTDIFEVPRADNTSPEILSFPILRDVTLQCVSAIGVEAMTELAEEARPACISLSAGRHPEELRPIASKGLPLKPSNASTPVLYHPLPHIAVLASPLVERAEYAPSALGRLRLDRDIFADVQAEKEDEVLVRRRIVLQYRCISKFDDKNPYKAISYGRVSSVDMFKTLLQDRARGKEIQSYMSLLLRRECAAASSSATATTPPPPTYPDGLLTVHGVPSEPLYVHYRSRADLRFTFSTICPPLQRSLLAMEAAVPRQRQPQSESGVEAVEGELFDTYAEAAAKYVRRIYEHVRSAQQSSDAAEQISLVFTLQPRDGTAPPHISVQVFPVYAADGETTERVLDQESIWQLPDSTVKNPHRAFSLYGSRFGRLAFAELLISYDVVDKEFHSRWNERFENMGEPV